MQGMKASVWRAFEPPTTTSNAAVSVPEAAVAKCDHGTIYLASLVRVAITLPGVSSGVAEQFNEANARPVSECHDERQDDEAAA